MEGAEIPTTEAGAPVSAPQTELIAQGHDTGLQSTTEVPVVPPPMVTAPMVGVGGLPVTMPPTTIPTNVTVPAGGITHPATLPMGMAAPLPAGIPVSGTLPAGTAPLPHLGAPAPINPGPAPVLGAGGAMPSPLHSLVQSVLQDSLQHETPSNTGQPLQGQVGGLEPMLPVGSAMTALPQGMVQMQQVPTVSVAPNSNKRPAEGPPR